MFHNSNYKIYNDTILVFYAEYINILVHLLRNKKMLCKTSMKRGQILSYKKNNYLIISEY